MNLETLSQTSGEWLRGTGPHSDIVISSRIRLARNLAEFPFPPRADEAASSVVEATIRPHIEAVTAGGPLTYFRVDGLSMIDRQFLLERQLISRELVEGKAPRGVAIGPEQSISVMVNEEDHLRLQVLRSGLALDECWADLSRLDDELQNGLDCAYSEEFGFLTSCPTNVGTGMRVSVMLHLPALVLTKEVQKVFQAMHKMSLAVRGLYGEGSQAMGDFYQISNQVTLGKTEDQLLNMVKRVVPDILSYERRMRDALIEKNRESLHDKVARALGTLQTARTITSEETLHHLSNVRLGINLGLISDVDIPTVNELFIHTQPAHLQKLHPEEFSEGDRSAARAAYMRKRLSKPVP